MRGLVGLALVPGVALAQEGGDAAPLTPLVGIAPPLHAPVPVVEMILAAHWVVQGVSLVLALGLFAVVTVLVFKAGELWLAEHRLRQSLLSLGGAGTLDEAARMLAGRRCAGAAMAAAAVEEYALALPLLAQAGPAGVKERVRARVERIAGRDAARLRRGRECWPRWRRRHPSSGYSGRCGGSCRPFWRSAQRGRRTLPSWRRGLPRRCW